MYISGTFLLSGEKATNTIKIKTRKAVTEGENKGIVTIGSFADVRGIFR